MFYKWNLPPDETGKILWVGSPIRGYNGIIQAETYMQLENKCYCCYHAWSVLPYLRIGSICKGQEDPLVNFAEKELPPFAIGKMDLHYGAHSVAELLKEDQPDLVDKMKAQEMRVGGVYFESGGMCYIIPFTVVLCAFLGNMTPLINGVLHEGSFDRWISNETINGSSIEVNFSSELSASFLSQPGIVNHIVWLRYTPELYAWWQSVAVSFYQGRFEVPIPKLSSEKLIFWGEQHKNYFLVHQMRVIGAKSPFQSITWTHPNVRKVSSDISVRNTAPHRVQRETDNPENDVTEFSKREIPHIDKIQNSAVLFDNPPNVRKKRMDNLGENVKKCGLSRGEESERVSTNEYAVGGKFRPMNTVPEVEPQGEGNISLRPEFGQFGEALDAVYGLRIVDVNYQYLNESTWAIITATYARRIITLVEGSKDYRPCASTLIWGGDNVPLDELLTQNVSWDKNRIKQWSQKREKKSALLKHYENRPIGQWGILLQTKIDKCL